MPSLIGNKPNQVPSNGDLGTLAFQDANAVQITGGVVDVSAGTAALPTLGTTGDENTGVFFPAEDTVAISTNGTERMRISSTGETKFSYNAVIETTDNTNAALRITQLGTGNALLVEDSANPDNTPVVISDTGRLVVGTTLPLVSRISSTSITPSLQVAGTSLSISSFGQFAFGTTPYHIFSRSASGTLGTNAIVTSGDVLGSIDFCGADGTNYVNSARIRAEVDGTPGTDDMPGRLVFFTTADGASVPSERMRITSAGGVSFGSSGTAYGTAGQVLTSNGDAAPTWGSAVFRATSVASTSGTAIDFTGIPSWVRKITVLLTGVSLSAAGTVVIQIGDSGGIETTGYVSNAVTIDSAGGLAHVASTTAFTLRDASAAGTIDAHVTISNISGNTWIASGTLNTTIANAETGCASGRKTLSDVLTQVRITRTAGNFDAGTVNIMYE